MPKEILLSDKSDKLKWFKALIDQKDERDHHKLCIVFGKKLMSEVEGIEAFITIPQNAHCPLLQNKDRYILSEAGFKKLSHLVNPDHYAALVKIPYPVFPKVIKRGILILDSLKDPGNIGTLYRTAMGLNLDGIIMLRPCVDPYHEKILRASKAICLQMPTLILEKKDLKKFLDDLNIKTYIAELSGEALGQVHNTEPFALILGNESQGVHSSLKELGSCIHIEQSCLESYNVAIAGAIIAYTLLPHKSV